MTLSARPMHRHNIRVTLTGPIDSLDELQQRCLQDALVSRVSDFGFKRDSQHCIQLEYGGVGDFMLNISVTNAAADAMSKQRFEAIEASLQEAMKIEVGMMPSIEGYFQRHPTPTGELMVV